MDGVFSVALPLALAFIMFSLGLGLGWRDFREVARAPKAFAVGLLGQLVALPLLAFALLQAVALPTEFAVGVMLLAFCPGGVTSNVLTRMAGGRVALSVALTGVISLLSIVTTPLLVIGAARWFGLEAAWIGDVDALFAATVLIVAAPMAAGMALRALRPQLTARVERPTYVAAIVVFALIIGYALASNWTLFLDMLPVLGPTLLLLIIAALGVAAALGWVFGLSGRDRVTVCLEVGLQNGGLAIALAGVMSSLGAEQSLPGLSIPAAVYSVLMYLVIAPLVILLAVWRRSRPVPSARR